MKRSSVLDVLKGICIVLVVLTHFAWDADERIRYLFPMWVDMAIPLCMILSGFVYTKSFLKKNIITKEQAYSWSIGGLYKRMIRYTVPFAFAWIIELVAYEALDLREMPSAIELLREFLCGGVGPGSYYYPVLIQLTLLFPLVYFLIIQYREKGLLLCCAANVAYELLQWAYGMPSSLYRLLVFRYLEIFAFGCYFAVGGKLRKDCGYVLFAAGILCSYINCTKDITLFFITNWKTTSFLTSLHAIPVFYWIHTSSFHFWPLEIIGKASYNIFLTQMVFYSVASSQIYRRIGNRVVCLAVVIVLCISSGVLFYYLETPVTNKCIAVADRLYSRLHNKVAEK